MRVKLPMFMFAALLPACAAEDAGELVLPTLNPGWNELDPGEGTICARGTKYSFFARPGTVNKVVIDFMGGGACWNEGTCSYAGALFSDDMDWMRDLVDADEFEGVYDLTDPENPFVDWYHVIVPYCTGDIHWGDAVTTYGEGDEAVTIEHRGAVNTRAILDWVESQFSGPEQIVVTGCSAGAYGSVMWAPHIQRMYPDAQVNQIGDGGAGVVTTDFFANSFPSWNATQAAPDWIPTLDPAQVDWSGLILPDLYSRVGAFYPEMTLSQINTELDWNQTLYFTEMGGEDAEAWSAGMKAYNAQIQATTPNFTQYLAAGDDHCMIPYTRLYETTEQGVPLVDWMASVANGERPAPVFCEGCEN